MPAITKPKCNFCCINGLIAARGSLDEAANSSGGRPVATHSGPRPREVVHSPPVLPVHAGAEVQVIILQAAAQVILDNGPGGGHALVLHRFLHENQQ